MSNTESSFMDIKDKKTITFACLNLLFIAIGIASFIACELVPDSISKPGNTSIFVSKYLPEHNLWFNFFGFFTWQTELLMLVVCIMYFFNIKYHFIKTPTLLLCGIGYLTVTFLSFNGVLLIFQPKSNFTSPLWWALNAPIHMICPIMCFLFTLFVFRIEKKVKGFHLNLKLRHFLIFMIYPTLYAIYVVAINFVKIKTSGGWDCPSIYGAPSNLNPHNTRLNENGKIEHGSAWKIAIVLLQLILLPIIYFVYSCVFTKKLPWRLFKNK